MISIRSPLCGSTDPTRLLEETEPSFRVLTCPVCDYGFVHSLPSWERLEEAYGEAYYEPWRNEDVAARQRTWAWRLGQVRNVSPKGKLLEAGAGDGNFLELASRAGYAVAAISFMIGGQIGTEVLLLKAVKKESD